MTDNYYSPQELRRSLFMLEMQIENLKTMIGIQQQHFRQIEEALELVRNDVKMCRHEKNHPQAEVGVESKQESTS